MWGSYSDGRLSVSRFGFGKNLKVVGLLTATHLLRIANLCQSLENFSTFFLKLFLLSILNCWTPYHWPHMRVLLLPEIVWSSRSSFVKFGLLNSSIIDRYLSQADHGRLLSSWHLLRSRWKVRGSEAFFGDGRLLGWWWPTISKALHNENVVCSRSMHT